MSDYLSDEIKRLLSPAINTEAPYAKIMIEKLEALFFSEVEVFKKVGNLNTSGVHVQNLKAIKDALENCEPAESGWLAEQFYAEEGSDEGQTALLKSKWAAHDKSEKQIKNALRIINEIEDGK